MNMIQGLTVLEREGSIPLEQIAEQPPYLGRDGGRTSIDSRADNLTYIRSLEQKNTQLEQEKAELKQENTRLQKENKRDGLTKIWNRRYFDQEIGSQVAQARRKMVREQIEEDESLSLLLIDIDHFKKYNDIHGHLFGDKVLEDTAQALEHASREYAKVCRYGGEEFAIIMPETSPLEAFFAAERYRKAVKEEAGVTVSIGIANYTLHVTDPYSLKANRRPWFDKEQAEVVVELITKADDALYVAKEMGRNGIVLYNETVANTPLRKRILSIQSMYAQQNQKEAV